MNRKYYISQASLFIVGLIFDSNISSPDKNTKPIKTNNQQIFINSSEYLVRLDLFPRSQLDDGMREWCDGR